MARKDSLLMQGVAEAVDEKIPDGYGFIVLVFPFTGTGGPEAGRAKYASNASRKKAVEALKEWLITNGAEDDWIKHHE